MHLRDLAERQQWSVGIDLGGTSTRVGLFDQEMKLRGSRAMPTRVAAGPQACVDEMAAALSALRQEARFAMGGVPLAGIGMGSPGPLNLRTGVLGLLPNLPGWEGFALRDRLAEATGLPVWLESDANAAAIAEWKLGAGEGSGLDSMGMLTLGTGVGSGLILAGRVWHGMFGMGGEAGHATVDPQGLLCGCGSRGCLEMYASANGLKRFARAAAEGSPALRALLEEPERFTPRAIAGLALEQGDACAKAAFEQLGFYLGIGIANLVNTLDLPMFVVGGGVAEAWPLFAPAMFRSLRQYSVVYRLVSPTQLERMETDRTFVRPAKLGSGAGLLGAALLPRLLGAGVGLALEEAVR